mgnify:CR=1 FL=1
MRNYYKILEIKKTATKEEIKKAYKKKVLEKHPDKNKGRERESEKEFILIKEAYRILSDTKEREKYDKKREEKYDKKREEKKKRREEIERERKRKEERERESEKEKKEMIEKIDSTINVIKKMMSKYEEIGIKIRPIDEIIGKIRKYEKENEKEIERYIKYTKEYINKIN